MTTEEMAVYIGERLFELCDVTRPDIPDNYRFSDSGTVCRFKLKQSAEYYTFSDAFHDWISSPEGIHAMKRAYLKQRPCYMISTMMNFECEWGDEVKTTNEEWHQMNISNDNEEYLAIETGKVESEVAILAIYRALKIEEDKA